MKEGRKEREADVWAALADGTRRDILQMLSSRPHTAGELADQFERSAATVSHHLAILRESGLVHCERRAQTLIYSLAPDGAKEAALFLQMLQKKARR